DVAVRIVRSIGRGMEGIARGMDAHKSKSPMDGIEQLLFTLRRHRRFLSVPTVVKSPVVKKSTAAYLWKSFESKTAPSLVAVTSKPCFFPSVVIAASRMLGLALVVFTTSCSNPEDLVKMRTDFLPAANRPFGRTRLAPATAPVCKN